MDSNRMTGAEALLRTLGGMGVARIFASPGSDWAPLWEALAQSYAPGEVPEYYSVRHEETAVAMASGYAKATGKLPAVVLHTTVGTLHATMAVRIALHERVPMVVLAGESIAFGEPPAPTVGRQWLRLLTDVGGPTRLIEPCVKWSFGLNTEVILVQTMQRACQLALTPPRGPVFVSVPIEFLLSTTSRALPASAGLPRPSAPEPSALDDIARALGAARNPLIITEEAGRDVGAVRSLVAVAEALGAPVVEAWQPYYVNFPRTHPLYGGVVTDRMLELAGTADAILLVEAVAPWHPPSALPRAGTKVFVLGEDPLRSHLPHWGVRADIIAPGDSGLALAALAERVTDAIPAATRADRLERIRARHQIERAAERASARAAADQPSIKTAWVAHELNAVLPHDAVVVNETITHRLDLLRQLERLTPGSHYESSFGGLGVGLGTALGVKHAQPDRTVIVTIGDGAFHYNPVVASFGASQELGLPLLVLLFDNAGYLSQKTDVINHFAQGAAVRTGKFAGTSITPRPDYARLAQAYGGYGEKIERPHEVRAALARGLEQVAEGRLALIDIVLDAVNA